MMDFYLLAFGRLKVIITIVVRVKLRGVRLFRQLRLFFHLHLFLFLDL